ncbi:MAG: hypothetical protein AAB922_04805 [Patescibacteria group bacterium]
MAKRGIINPLFGMTDAAFWGKIRSALRKIWTSSQAHKDAISRAKVPAPEGGRRKYKIKCPECERLYNLGEKIKLETKKEGKYKFTSIYHVDHKEEGGSLKGFEDLAPFVHRLFLGQQEALCYHCHQNKHHGEAAG